MKEGDLWGSIISFFDTTLMKNQQTIKPSKVQGTLAVQFLVYHNCDIDTKKVKWPERHFATHPTAAHRARAPRPQIIFFARACRARIDIRPYLPAPPALQINDIRPYLYSYLNRGGIKFPHEVNTYPFAVAGFERALCWQ